MPTDQDGNPVTPAELPPKSRRHVVEWLVWCGIAGLAIAQAGNFDQQIPDYAFGADGWPLAICVAILAGATLQLLFSLRRRRQEASTALATGRTETGAGIPVSDDRADRLTPLLAAVFILPFVFLVLTPWIGFYITAPAFVVALLLCMQVRSPAALVLVTASVYGIALLVFARFLYVALPVGRIQPFYDINNAIISLVRAGL